MCIAQAADIFGTGLVAGAFVMGAFAVHPAAASLDPAPHVLLRQELIRRLSRFLPPFMLLPVPSSLYALGLCRTSGVAAARRTRMRTVPGHYCDHSGGQRAAQPTLWDLVARRIASRLARLCPSLECGAFYSNDTGCGCVCMRHFGWELNK